jgi:DNA-binding transcriptional LysR family regulator
MKPDTLSRIHWDDVRVFLALYRARTMGEAARALGVDTSTVSRRLVQLEEALDAALFARGRDGVRPTEAAEELLARAEQVEAAFASFANTADALEREVSGVVRVTCPPDMAAVVVLPVLEGLFEAHPELRVVLDPGESTADLGRREADLAVRVSRPTRGDMITRKLLDVRFLPAASPTYRAGLPEAAAPDDVRWIGWGDGFREAPPARWLDAHVSREPVLRTDRLTTQIEAARQGLGVALVPEPSIAHYGLAPLAFEGVATPSAPVYLVAHELLRGVPRVRVVWDALVAWADRRAASARG